MSRPGPLAVLLCVAPLFALAAGCTTPETPPPADSDMDGLTDDEERQLGTDPQRADTDGDGVGDAQESEQGRDPTIPEAEPRVVVAVIDTGINVYHERFQDAAGLPAGILDQIRDAANDGLSPVPVRLAQQGSYDERLEQDQATWDGLQTGTLYYFEGTRVLGVSFDGSGIPVLDEGSHGTMTAGSVMDHNPDAIVVLVEGTSQEAEAWVAQQPWIDLVSMSYGPPGSVPGSGQVLFGGATYRHTRAMWDLGQLPVGAADNTPALAPGDETAGPPWVVGVAGDDPQASCREHVSGNAPDFTADFTQELPDFESTTDRHEASGTSFSTPATAGTMSRVLLEVRQAWGHTGGITDGALAVGPDGARLTQAGLRDAFNRTATYFPTAECGPGGHPVNPAAPWVQQGWGHVGVEIVNATVAHILGTEPAPEKPAAAVQHQESIYAARQQFWSRFP